MAAHFCMGADCCAQLDEICIGAGHSARYAEDCNCIHEIYRTIVMRRSTVCPITTVRR
jgi:hypothetical protein